MADGPGFRTAIYCAGCKHGCKGCHNPQSWDFKAGKWMDVEELLEIVKADSMSNVTFSGGDPMYQAPAFTELARRIKEETGKTIDEIYSERNAPLLGRPCGRPVHPGAERHGPPFPWQPQSAYHLPSRKTAPG